MKTMKISLPDLLLTLAVVIYFVYLAVNALS